MYFLRVLHCGELLELTSEVVQAQQAFARGEAVTLSVERHLLGLQSILGLCVGFSDLQARQ